MDQRDILAHFKKLKEGVQLVGAEAFLNMDTFDVEVRMRDQVYVLYPLFATRINGALLHTPALENDVARLAGWRPYLRAPAISFATKLKFKELLSRHHCATPEYSTAADSAPADVVVKKTDAAFGVGTKGPFRSPSEYRIDPQQGEFYEKFIPGRLVKLWFWNHRPVHLEISEMPAVIGDGRATLGDLIAKKPTLDGQRPDRDQLAQVLAFYKKDADSVLPKEQRQIVDFRHSTIFSAENIEETDPLTTRGLKFENQFWQLGEILGAVLLQEGHANAVFTVDAVLDADDKLWFLEADFNSAIHPSIYPAMFKGLLESQMNRTPARPFVPPPRVN